MDLDVKKQPIIFLDYDGVIIDSGSRLVTGSRDGFNSTSVGLIKRLQDKFNALMVCSSRAHAKTKWHQQEFALVLNSIELKFYQDDDFPMSWRTAPSRSLPNIDNLPKYESRGLYAKDWLDLHGYDWIEDPYIMIDDDFDFYPIDESRYHHVKGGELNGGFNFDDYIKVHDKLKITTGIMDVCY